LAADTSKFEHIWSALMRVLGTDHRHHYQANKIILRTLDAQMKRK
jgi:hypothetical protein